MTIHRYWSSNCKTCAVKAQCTPSGCRRISRWEHEEVLDTVQRRLDHTPDAMRIRRQTVEHPFGTIKSWMGSTHFLTKTLDRVSAEMSLHVLAYNMKRMVAILGAPGLMTAIKAWEGFEHALIGLYRCWSARTNNFLFLSTMRIYWGASGVTTTGNSCGGSEYSVFTQSGPKAGSVCPDDYCSFLVLN